MSFAGAPAPQAATCTYEELLSRLPTFDRDTDAQTSGRQKFWRELQDSLHENNDSGEAQALEALEAIIWKHMSTLTQVAPMSNCPLSSLDFQCGFPKQTMRTMMAWNPETLRRRFTADYPGHPESLFQNDLTILENALLAGNNSTEIQGVFQQVWSSTTTSGRVRTKWQNRFLALHPDFQRRALPRLLTGRWAAEPDKTWAKSGRNKVYTGMLGAPYGHYSGAARGGSASVPPSAAPSSVTTASSYTNTVCDLEDSRDDTHPEETQYSPDDLQESGRVTRLFPKMAPK